MNTIRKDGEDLLLRLKVQPRSREPGEVALRGDAIVVRLSAAVAKLLVALWERSPDRKFRALESPPTGETGLLRHPLHLERS